MQISKTRSSFYRRLYVAWLIDSGQACTVPALMTATGMHRRTAQDTLAALGELDIECSFAQQQGERKNAGHYQIRDWGPINRDWIEQHLEQLKVSLGYP